MLWTDAEKQVKPAPVSITRMFPAKTPQISMTNPAITPVNPILR
jgi:hypothetical protein